MQRLGIALCALVPTAAHASGGDILTLLWLELLLLIAVVLSVVFGKLTSGGKVLVLGVYVVGVVFPWWLTSSWPYSENLVLINTLCIGVPVALWLPTFAIARKRHGQT